MKKMLMLSTTLLAFAAVGSAAHADEAAARVAETVTVYGQNEVRQVLTLRQAEISTSAPGSSPIKLVAKLPGVNFQSADAFGSYEWSTRITVRGFNQNQLGFTLDDVPLGDMSYANHNGLHISRAVITENLSSVALAQGSGAIDTASTSNLGGTLKFRTLAPSDEFGGVVALTGGTDGNFRGFIRLDSGELASGTRGYISYVRQQADKWKGVGAQEHDQFNLKIVQKIGNASLTGFYNWSDRAENDYQDLSFEMIRRLGYNWDNISGDYALATRIADIARNRGDVGGARTDISAGTVYPGLITSVDDAYFDASGLRKDNLGGLTLDWPITEAVSLKATAYKHTNEGQGTWFTPYVTSPSGAPISVRTTEYDIDRTGLVASLNWTLGNHDIEGGFWIEQNEFNQARRFYGLERGGNTRPSLSFMSNPFFTQWQYEYNTDTVLLHIQDTWSVSDDLTINFGVKSMNVETSGRAIVDVGGAKNGTIKVEENFLPQVGFTYDLNENTQLFGSIARNARAFIGSNTTGPFATTQIGFNAIKNTLQPETSTSGEGGVRFKITGGLEGVAAVYYTKFEDRLLGVTLGPGIVGAPVALSNVGGVISAGIETAITYTISDAWSLYGSYSFNDATYEGNTRDGAGNVVFTDGKQIVDTPKHLFKAELSYDDTKLFGKLGLSYTSDRHYTYLNDRAVEGATLIDASVGYRLGGSPLFEGVDVQLNITNLLDEEYVSTLGSNGFVNSDRNGTSQTLLAGAPRQVFITARKAF